MQIFVVLRDDSFLTRICDMATTIVQNCIADSKIKFAFISMKMEAPSITINS